ncbi:MAG: dihydropteroate synthase [Myxococcota bacterium]
MRRRPIVMGIVNVTPDSFYDGGRHGDSIAHARQLVSEGADWIDVGGESTRPGAEPVPVQEELARVLPVIEALSAEVPVSVDTTKPAVAQAAAAAGATILNDVRGLRDPEMVAVSALFDKTVIMHSRGTPKTMRGLTEYSDLIAEVRDVLVERAEQCKSREVWLDPGIGFAKGASQSLSLLKHLPTLVATGYPVLVGASRKSFIGRTLDRPDADDRLAGSLAAAAAAAIRGAAALRVHDVRATRDVVALLYAIEQAD